ncbi:DNA-3-methyladenine glycosylase II [hydrothermal vent metagenome]|uniref:DNA-3-methyladenine glycosylase II n=1 Tax=hydrothermal vent metagenome TaxID=652676 RepID=A0A3B1CSD8_9ZZZZ
MKDILNSSKLEKPFYVRDVVKVAKDLLGKTLVRKVNGRALAGTIVEVEAYDAGDEASHSFNGRSQRNDVMFEEGGLLYVYFIYGVHYCCNIVTGKAEHGAAVLIRAVEPLNHFDYLAKNRFGKTGITGKERTNLTNGPAKLCQAFKIGRAENGTDLTGAKIYLLDAPKLRNKQIVQTTRIGITKSKELPWRFYIKDNAFVSKK